MGDREPDPLKQAVAAARAGQKERARELLLQVIALDERTEAAWLWLSSVVDTPEERRICLENVLALNPDNRAAQAGLQWLVEQERVPQDSPRPDPHPRPETAPRAMLKASSPQLGSPEPPALQGIEIDPYGCPYCGGSVSGQDSACDHCRRPVAIRYRKRAGGMWLGWVVVFFLLQGAVALGQGFVIDQLMQMGRLAGWVGRSAAQLLIGAALLSPQGLADSLAEFAQVIVVIDVSLASLCVAAAVGLALRSRVFYFGSFLLAGLVVMAAGAGLLTQLTGLLPTLFQAGLAAISVKWLVDSAPAFEWETRPYNADVDPDLRTDLDYYNSGLRYRELGMWAKAAAHWQVATRLAPSQVKYQAALANAYLKMGYPEAALSAADRAVALAPDEEDLVTFRDSIARLSRQPDPVCPKENHDHH